MDQIQDRQRRATEKFASRHARLKPIVAKEISDDQCTMSHCISEHKRLCRIPVPADDDNEADRFRSVLASLRSRARVASQSRHNHVRLKARAFGASGWKQYGTGEYLSYAKTMISFDMVLYCNALTVLIVLWNLTNDSYNVNTHIIESIIAQSMVFWDQR